MCLATLTFLRGKVSLQNSFGSYNLPGPSSVMTPQPRCRHCVIYPMISGQPWDNFSFVVQIQSTIVILEAFRWWEWDSLSAYITCFSNTYTLKYLYRALRIANSSLSSSTSTKDYVINIKKEASICKHHEYFLLLFLILSSQWLQRVLPKVKQASVYPNALSLCKRLPSLILYSALYSFHSSGLLIECKLKIPKPIYARLNLFMYISEKYKTVNQ